MNYDSNVALPEIAVTIATVAQQLRDKPLANNQSFFLENYPLEHLPALNSAIMAGYNTGVYTKADPIFGGAGVRIFSIGVLNKPNNVGVEQRTEGDWTAPRNGVSVWDKRITKWFGYELGEMAFYWNKDKQQVEVVTIDGDASVLQKCDCYQIEPQTAFAFMCEQGKHYRNGLKEPTPAQDLKRDNASMIWVGFKQVVWNYNVTDDVVKEFSNRADADYEVSSKGIKYQFEDAPLVAWLAYNAAKVYKTPKSEPTYDVDDL